MSELPTNTALGAVFYLWLSPFHARVKIVARRFLINIGLRVKEERDLLGISQAQLAEIVGVDVGTLQRTERGVLDIGVLRLLDLAVALNVLPQSLLTKPDPRTRRRAGRPRKV